MALLDNRNRTYSLATYTDCCMYM